MTDNDKLEVLSDLIDSQTTNDTHCVTLKACEITYPDDNKGCFFTVFYFTIFLQPFDSPKMFSGTFEECKKFIERNLV